jgi:hypothetical protein
MLFQDFKRIVIAGLCLAAVVLIGVPNASAQRWDRATAITVNHPFEVPGIVLPAGKYVVRLVDVAGTRTVFQILNADETKSYGMVLGIPDYKFDYPEKSELSFYEAEPGAPVPLRSWFYPGYHYGVAFVYPKDRAANIARVSGGPVFAAAIPDSAVEVTPEELENAPGVETWSEHEFVAETPEFTEPLPVEEAAVPAPEPVFTAEAEVPEGLPRTASPFPLLALTGLLAAGAAGGLRMIRLWR